MSSESVCQVARSWVDVGSFSHAFSGEVYDLQRQSGIFWIDPRIQEHSHSSQIENLVEYYFYKLTSLNWRYKGGFNRQEPAANTSFMFIFVSCVYKGLISQDCS
jgi:hypothetical protein